MVVIYRHFFYYVDFRRFFYIKKTGEKMSRQIQIRRGTSAEHDNFTGAIGEITMDTTIKEDTIKRIIIILKKNGKSSIKN